MRFHCDTVKRPDSCANNGGEISTTPIAVSTCRYLARCAIVVGGADKVGFAPVSYRDGGRRCIAKTPFAPETNAQLPDE
jgi:hypothetical protein